MFKHFFKKSNEDDIFETVDPIVEQRRNEKFSKPLIYDEEFKKDESIPKKSTNQQLSKETTSKNVNKIEKKAEKEAESEIKKNYEMKEIISPMFGMNEVKKETAKTVKKKAVKKAKKKDNSLIQVISPYYGNFEEKEDSESEAVLTTVEENENTSDISNLEDVNEEKIVDEEKLPTVEDNLRNIAKIVEEEQDQLKIIEERTGEFKLDFGQKKSEEQNSLIDEIDDNMSLDELMSLYEKKFKD